MCAGRAHSLARSLAISPARTLRRRVSERGRDKGWEGAENENRVLNDVVLLLLLLFACTRRVFCELKPIFELDPDAQMEQ